MPPDPCKSLEDQIAMVKAEMQALEDFTPDPGTPPAVLASIAKQIIALRRELTQLEEALALCERMNSNVAEV